MSTSLHPKNEHCSITSHEYKPVGRAEFDNWRACSSFGWYGCNDRAYPIGSSFRGFICLDNGCGNGGNPRDISLHYVACTEDAEAFWRFYSCPNGKGLWQPCAYDQTYSYNAQCLVSLGSLGQWFRNGGSWMEPGGTRSYFTGRYHLFPRNVSIARMRCLKRSKQHRQQPFQLISVRSPGATTEMRRHFRQVLNFLILARGCSSGRRVWKPPVAWRR